MASAVAMIEQRPSASLELPDNLPMLEWVRIGRRLCASSQMLNWQIGDWWAFGEHKYGERARAAAEGVFGREFQTLVNLGNVSNKFESNRRRLGLTWSHHAEVSPLLPDEADDLLERAEREGLSTRDLRAEVARRRQPEQHVPRQELDPIEQQTRAIVDAWNKADIRARKDFIERQRQAGLNEIADGARLIDQEPLPIDAFSEPARLAMVTRGPFRVCRLLFKAAGDDPAVAQLIRSEQKDDETNRLRRAVILVAKLHTEASLPEIGRVVGRDHSAVLRSLEKAKILWVRDDEFRALCGRLTMEIA